MIVYSIINTFEVFDRKLTAIYFYYIFEFKISAAASIDFLRKSV